MFARSLFLMSADENQLKTLEAAGGVSHKLSLSVARERAAIYL